MVMMLPGVELKLDCANVGVDARYDVRRRDACL